MNTRRSFVKKAAGTTLIFGMGISSGSAATQFTDASGKKCDAVNSSCGRYSESAHWECRGSYTVGGASCTVICAADLSPVSCSLGTKI